MQDGGKCICKHKVKEQNKELKKWLVLIMKEGHRFQNTISSSICVPSTEDMPEEDLASLTGGGWQPGCSILHTQLFFQLAKQEKRLQAYI